MGKIIELYSADGELVAYRPLSARLPAFLAVYGPEQGFSVETEILDTLSLKPGLMKLYEIALQAGRKPEEAGLPPLGTVGQTLVCRATLRDREGWVWATATAAKLIQAYKDLEVLETAARQRLLAALGFGGDVLDRDETQDQADQGLSSRAPAVAAKPGTVASSPDAEAANLEAEVAKLAEAASPDAPASSPEAEAATSPASERDAAALAALVRQIEQQARLRGMTPPVVTNRAEARAALQQLLRRA